MNDFKFENSKLSIKILKIYIQETLKKLVLKDQ